MKKLTKREQFKREVTGIARQKVLLYKIAANYDQFIAVQKILARPFKRRRRDKPLQEALRERFLDEYLVKEKRAEHWMLYCYRYEMWLKQLGYAWSSLGRGPWMPEQEIEYWRIDETFLWKRFKELNPEKARLDDLFGAYIKIPLALRNEPWAKMVADEVFPAIKKDPGVLIELRSFQDFLYNQAGIVFWVGEDGEMCWNGDECLANKKKD